MKKTPPKTNGPQNFQEMLRVMKMPSQKSLPFISFAALLFRDALGLEGKFKKKQTPLGRRLKGTFSGAVCC